MTTKILVDKDYKVVKREVRDEKELPNRLLELIALTLKRKRT